MKNIADNSAITHTLRVLAAVCVISIAPIHETAADETDGIVKLSLSYYLDERDFNTLEIGISSTRTLFGFSLWGFTDLHGDQGGSRDADFDQSFSEYRLSHAGIGEWLNLPGLGAQIEFNIFTPGSNDVTRFGLTYRHDLPLPWSETAGRDGWLQWRVFPYETDGDGGQLSLIYNIPLFSRISISGFADYNIREGAPNRWIVEPQLNVKLSPRISALLELRYNEFEDASPTLDGFAPALGLRFDF